MIHDGLLRRAWAPGSWVGTRALRTYLRRFQRKPDGDADNPTYIFTEPRVGCWMPKREAPDQEEA